MVLTVFGAEYWFSMCRHFLGQFSTQDPHCTQSILLMVHVRPSLSTVIAWVGHLLEQIPQRMQSGSTMEMWPLVLSCQALGTTGYMRVAGFLNKLDITNFQSLKIAISLTYLSVQLMQGSMVSTSIGTSARSHPCSVFTIAGMLALVGVLTRIRSRNLVPWPFA